MHIDFSNILALGSILLIISVVSSKTSLRVGIPTLLVFILVGMLAGSEGVGGVHFDQFETAQFLSVIALDVILFTGGMGTSWTNIRHVWRCGTLLSILGVLITAITAGVLFHLIVPHFTWPQAFLTGAIISSTDAASTFAIFRQRRFTLKNRLQELLEFESGSNDPMAYFLTISLIELIRDPTLPLWMLIPDLIRGMLLGAVIGVVIGYFGVRFINRIRLDIDGLYPILVIAISFFAYSLSASFNGNGFLTVYVMGVVMGNTPFVHQRSVMKFMDGCSWLMQIVMFLTLGLLAVPSQVFRAALPGVVLSVLLIFVARPIAVWICTITTKYSLREKIFLAWAGLRGACPIIFAVYPLVYGIPKAELIFNIIFFVSCASLLLQGATIFWSARKLDLIVSNPESDSEVNRLYEEYRSELYEIEISEASQVEGHALLELHIPDSILVVLIERDGKYFHPDGSTLIRRADRLFVVGSDRDEIELFREGINVPSP